MKSRIVSPTVLLITLAIPLLTSLRVIGYGYLPADDALRHAAKAVSGKPWNEILLLREGITMDSHPGWHTILSALHEATGASADALVVFSVVSLFFLFCVVPALLLERPEAWPVALATLFVTLVSPLLYRLLLGRPFILTMAVTAALCLLWPAFRTRPTPWLRAILVTTLIALSSWIHGLWYMFALPVLCLFFAREWRAGTVIGVCSAVGVLLGAALTGRPIAFFGQSVDHMVHALGDLPLTRMLVGEFQPESSDPLALVLVFAVYSWHRLRGSWTAKVVDNPVFILAAVGWVLGLYMRRFWEDWGLPALCAWGAIQIQVLLVDAMGPCSLRRVGVALGAAMVLYPVITSDIGNRYSSSVEKEYLDASDPALEGWLPDAGGIVYSDSMYLFYDTFFKNPHANWRYVLGFEPTGMPAEDLEVFRTIQRNYRGIKSYQGWVGKLRPEDRLIIKSKSWTPPSDSELEWHHALPDIWIGRLPRSAPK